ncbi:MAG: hypothetical protein ABFS30_10485, partial [Pseudomonadota bacterium]
MKQVKTENGFEINTSNYTLKYDAAEPMHVDLRFGNGLGGKLFVASGCDKGEEIDSLVSLGAPLVNEVADAVEIVFAGNT